MKRTTTIGTLALFLLALLTVPGYSAPSASEPIYHVVRYGETLFSIGRLYGVYPYDIARDNGIINPDRIYVGQVLRIYGVGTWSQPRYGYGCPWVYVVRYGDTLSSISWRYGVNMWSIARANHIYNLHYIYAGQRLIIPCW